MLSLQGEGQALTGKRRHGDRGRGNIDWDDGYH